MKLNIEQLENTQDRKISLQFNEKIAELVNFTTVVGELTATSNGMVILISGHVETDAVLECDRCMAEYSLHLAVDIDESYVKGKIFDESRSEVELRGEHFVEELGNTDEIDITDLVYQSVILNLPNKKLCDITCKGKDEFYNSHVGDIIDPRLQIFKDITIK